jgi:hypothetical protein
MERMSGVGGLGVGEKERVGGRVRGRVSHVRAACKRTGGS